MKSRPLAPPVFWLLVAALALCVWMPPEIHTGSRVILAAVAALLSCLLAAASASRVLGQTLPHVPGSTGEGDVPARHHALLVLIVSGLLASSLLSLNPYRSVHLLVALAGACAFYLGCRRWASGAPQLWAASFLFISVLVALVACLQAAGGLEHTLAAALEADPELPGAWRTRLESGRVFGTLLLPATLGGLMGMALPVAVGFAGTLRGAGRLGALLAAGLLLVALALSRSYGAVAATALAAVWAAGRLPARRALWLRLGVLAAAILVVLLFSSARYRSAGQRLLEPQGPVVQRWLNWKTASNVLARYPVLGSGPGAYASAFVSLRQEGENDTRYVHNTPLQAAAEAGLWILVPLVLGVARLYPRLSRALRAGPLEAGVATGVIMFLVHNLADFTAYLPATLWAALALAALLPVEPGSGGVALNRGARFGFSAALALVCLASLGPVTRQWRGETLRDQAREAVRQPDVAHTAKPLYEAAVQADPTRADLRLEVARFLLDDETGDPVQALEQAKAAAHQDRGSALAHSLMSNAWAARQEWAEAYVHAQAAVTLHPHSRQARAWLERLEEHLDAGRR
ncbi:MAG: O-antigen ligase family protein [Acidobacteriota bacterium]